MWSVSRLRPANRGPVQPRRAQARGNGSTCRARRQDSGGFAGKRAFDANSYGERGWHAQRQGNGMRGRAPSWKQPPSPAPPLAKNFRWRDQEVQAPEGGGAPGVAGSRAPSRPSGGPARASPVAARACASLRSAPRPRRCASCARAGVVVCRPAGARDARVAALHPSSPLGDAQRRPSRSARATERPRLSHSDRSAPACRCTRSPGASPAPNLGVQVPSPGRRCRWLGTRSSSLSEAPASSATGSRAPPVRDSPRCAASPPARR